MDGDLTCSYTMTAVHNIFCLPVHLVPNSASRSLCSCRIDNDELLNLRFLSDKTWLCFRDVLLRLKIQAYIGILETLVSMNTGVTSCVKDRCLDCSHRRLIAFVFGA